MPQNKSKTTARVPHGEDYLKTLEGTGAITLALENKEDVAIDVAAELRIPTDPVALAKAARNMNERAVFWRHQANRAKHAVRVQERIVAETRGRTLLLWRKHIDENTDRDSSEFGVLAAHVDADDDVRRETIKLNTLRRTHEKLDAVAQGTERRCFVIQGLLRTEAEGIKRA